MKKLISICLLVLLALRCNAQEHYKQKYSELNQDQLYFALKKASKTVKTGKILTIAGPCAITTGVLLFIGGVNEALAGDSISEVKIAGGYVFILGGIVSTIAGVPVWISGAKKKKKVTLELEKFNLKGTASTYGIGIKVMF
jgi:hypothetical protein